jgi:opacity protein-like surface antigen
MKKTRTVLATALAAAALATPLQASAQAPADRWTFSVMPYLWLPGINGTLNYGPPPPGGGSASVDVSESSVLDALDFAFMINGEARKGRWLVATDVIYLDFGKNDSSVQSVDFNLGPRGRINVAAGENSGTQSKLTGWLWTLVGGYAAVQDPRWNLDVIGGFRFLNLEARTDWQINATLTVTDPIGGGTATFARQGSVEKSDNIWAGIVGAKGRVKLGETPWFVNYYADAGGASNLFTWQGAAGVGYAFTWGEILFDYRYLYYDQSGQDKLIQDVSFGGFALGANFRF